MTIRDTALVWYERKYGRIDGPIYTTKLYQPHESWPKKTVWWPKIPIRIVEENLSGHIKILCQVAPNENHFYYLKIPAKFLHNHLEKFHILQNKISLYLSTDPKTLFVEERGKGNLNFRQLLVD